MRFCRGPFVAIVLCLGFGLSGCGGGSGGGGSTSAIVSPSAPPPPPAATPNNLTALPGNSVVSLSWSASSGATGYNVLRSTVNGGPYVDTATGVTAASYADTSVANGTTYYYVVQATNSGGTRDRKSVV